MDLAGRPLSVSTAVVKVGMERSITNSQCNNMYALYLIVKVLRRKVLNNYLRHYFLRLQLIMGPPFHVAGKEELNFEDWSPGPNEGQSACRSGKGLPSFLIYIATLSIGLAPGIEPVTSHSVVKLYRLN